MADRVLVWFIDNDDVLRAGSNVGAEYVLDDDYVPVRVTMSQKTAPTSGDDPTVIDINYDGTSVFGSNSQPSVGQGITRTEYEVFDETLAYLEKDALITLDIDSVGAAAGRALTVALELDRA